jgi:hypothetical protein
MFIVAIVDNTLNILLFTYLKLYKKNLSAAAFFNCIYLIMFFIRSITKHLLIKSIIVIKFWIVCFVAVDQLFSTNYCFYQQQICTYKLTGCLTYTFVSISFIHDIIGSFFYNLSLPSAYVFTNSVWLTYARLQSHRYSIYWLFKVFVVL